MGILRRQDQEYAQGRIDAHDHLFVFILPGCPSIAFGPDPLHHRVDAKYEEETECIKRYFQVFELSVPFACLNPPE